MKQIYKNTVGAFLLLSVVFYLLSTMVYLKNVKVYRENLANLYLEQNR